MKSERQSVLASRHEKLGAGLGEWNQMDVPWEYTSDVNEEHIAIRTAAGLFDVSALKKVHILGPDALCVVDHAVTRDLKEIPYGRSVYALVLNEKY
jgi:aminomethyltransferase